MNSNFEELLEINLKWLKEDKLTLEEYVQELREIQETLVKAYNFDIIDEYAFTTYLNMVADYNFLALRIEK